MVSNKKTQYFYLYKYMNIDGVFPNSSRRNRLDAVQEILLNKEIYIPSPSQLNDPFEDLLNTSENSKDDKNIGVLSLTSNPKSILMWSHYADSHRGIVIKFKYTIQENIQLIKVSYIFDKQEIGLLKPLSFKSIDWSYENEYRIIISSIGSRCISLESLGLSIDGIIFGLNCSDDHKNILEEILTCENYKYGRVLFDHNLSCKDLGDDSNISQLINITKMISPEDVVIQEILSDFYSECHETFEQYDLSDYYDYLDNEHLQDVELAKNSDKYKNFINNKEKLKNKYKNNRK